MSNDPEDRAEQLQGRFSSPDTDEASRTSDSSPTGEASDTPEASDTSNTSKAGKTETTPLRDRPTKLLYLEEEQKKDLELAFDELNLRYKRERGEELEQNNDWWPVLLRIGYEAIGDVRDVDLEKFDQARDGQFAVPGPDEE